MLNLCLLFPENSGYHKYHIDAFKKLNENTSTIPYLDIYKKSGVTEIQRYTANYIKDNNIDVLIMGIEGLPFFELEFLAELRKDTMLCLLLFDDEVLHFNNKYYAQLVDLVISTDPCSIEMYRKFGNEIILYLSSYTKEVYKPIDMKYKYDVSFVGLVNKFNRMKFMDQLKNSDIKYDVFGKGSSNGFVTEERMVEIFNQSKINLNFTATRPVNAYNYNDPITEKARQAKGRSIEAALTKSFCLSEYAPQLETNWEIGKEIDVFHTPEEMIQKIQYYLDHEDERNEMAERAYNKALELYEMTPYLTKVINKIENIRTNIDWVSRINETPDYCYSPHLLKVICNGRLRKSIALASKLKFGKSFREVKFVLKQKKLNLNTIFKL